MTAFQIFLGALFIVICLLLIVVVLLQKGRGGGLSGVFGGAGSSAFGTRTGDVFTWVTIVLTALFLLLAIGANFAFRPKIDQAAKPEFAPGQGTYSGTTEVVITSATGGADIRYTDDGTEPTKGSSRVSPGIPVKVTPKPGQPVTLKARAFGHASLRDSEIATAVYTFGVPTTTTSRPATAPGATTGAATPRPIPPAIVVPPRATTRPAS